MAESKHKQLIFYNSRGQTVVKLPADFRIAKISINLSIERSRTSESQILELK